MLIQQQSTESEVTVEELPVYDEQECLEDFEEPVIKM